ncbi:MAG TPA: hypothetical protein VGG85_14995 [Terracidiphilus sp.]|jgi:hypothetical protein
MLFLPCRSLLLLVAVGLATSALPAQQSPPQDYSLTVTSMMTVESMFTGTAAQVKVYRVGAREFADIQMAPRPGQTTGAHIKRWFDMQNHKTYTLDAEHKACSWMTFNVTRMPGGYDPLAMPPPPADELAKMRKADLPKESVNGIPARILESEGGDAKTRIWMAEKGDFAVKAQMMMPNGAPMQMFEVKEIHFEKPAEAQVAPPANCPTQATGVWDDNGMSGHGEMSVEVHGSGSTDLKTGKSKGDVTVKQTNH